ncbi:hypothetical protein DY000_02007523 [Brassica cretica]|uniref:Uncharacterized protein n=1 Tax=Brassica cretica TaxID=69181 RepID=A0ABQ7CIK9_BRACR|nr:hypothetical protein DY000_02007523 [Brassica cretica]
MSDTHYHGEEISADTYATLRRHQFNLASLGERLQRMENTTATMKEKWRRGDEAMRDFTGGGPWYRTRNTSQRGPRASPSEDPEAGVLPGAFPRQDIASVILLSRTEKLGAFGGVLEMAEPGVLVPDASKDTRVDSPFQGSVPFCETSLFKEDFSFSRKDRVSFSYACRLCQGFYGIFGNIPISFSGSAKRDDPDVYKGTRYPLIGLNPIPVLNSRHAISSNWPQSNSSADFQPRRLFTDPFSSPIPSWGDVLEADNEAVPMAPLRRRRSCFFDDGPRSEVREGDLANIRRKYTIHPSVGMRSPSEFERAPDRGASEVAVYEANLEAGFRDVIPSLIGEVSSFFSFCPSQLTPLTWRTVIAIQVLGELHGFSVGEPSRDIRGNYPFGDSWNNRYVFVNIQEPVGNVVRLSVSAIYDEHQKGKAQKRRPFYTPPPRMARAALSVNGLSSTSSTGAEAVSYDDPLVDAHRRLIGKVLFLRSQVQDMMARRDLLIQQVKAPARWEFMKEWLEKRVEHWDPEEEYHRRLFLSGGIDQQLGNFSRVATPRSVVRSRFSEEPSS